MPRYDVTCSSPDCSHAWEEIRSMREPHVFTCPVCGAAGVKQISMPRLKHTWDGQESKSLSLAFDPRAIKQLKQEIPSLELAADGSAVFRNDTHQRQVYREINDTMDRYDREARDALTGSGDAEIATAAQAISGTFDVTDALAPMLAGDDSNNDQEPGGDHER